MVALWYLLVQCFGYSVEMKIAVAFLRRVELLEAKVKIAAVKKPL